MNKIKIILADDHNIVLNGLEAYFDQISEIQVVGMATHGDQLLAMLRSIETDIVVLDIEMPGKAVQEVLSEILKSFPKLKVLILSMHEDYKYIKKFRDMGVDGYILKGSEATELLAAIQTLSEGREYFSKKVTEIFRSGKSGFIETIKLNFTRREKAVLYGLAKGWDNRMIAEELGVSSSTVETFMKNIRAKTNLKGQRELVVFAINNGHGIQKPYP